MPLSVTLLLKVKNKEGVMVAVEQKLTEGEMDVDTVMEYVALPL